MPFERYPVIGSCLSRKLNIEQAPKNNFQITHDQAIVLTSGGAGGGKPVAVAHRTSNGRKSNTEYQKQVHSRAWNRTIRMRYELADRLRGVVHAINICRNDQAIREQEKVSEN